jgi:hypothetical protein
MGGPDLKPSDVQSKIQCAAHLALKPGVAPAKESTMTTPANEKVLDAAGIEARMDAVRLKQMLGGALTEQERMCLQIEQSGFGCCSSPTYAVDPGKGED